MVLLSWQKSRSPGIVFLFQLFWLLPSLGHAVTTAPVSETSQVTAANPGGATNKGKNTRRAKALTGPAAKVVDDPNAKEQTPTAGTSNEGFTDVLIRKNIEMSQIFSGVADDIDIFIAGRRLTTKRNETSVTIENSSSYNQGEKDIYNISHLNANFRFPNVEEYWQFKFTTYDEQDEKRGIKKGTYRQGARQQNVGAQLGLAQSFGPIRTSFQPRLQIANPLQVSHSLTFETVALWKAWKFNPKLEFFANPDKGTGIYNALNFSYEMNQRLTLLLVNDGEYEEKQNLFSTSNGISLVRTFSDRASISYNFFINSNSRPAYHLSAYSFSVVWSQLIYKNILDYQLIPHLDFYADAFRGIPGLIFNLNLTF